MDQFLERYEEEYELPLTLQNEDLTPVLDYVGQCKKIFYNKNRRLFECNRTLTLMDVLSTEPTSPPYYMNFTYNNHTYLVSYNFAYKVIVVYMGRKFVESDLEWFASQIPKLPGFKILKNYEKASFRYNTYDPNQRAYAEMITDNVLKFITEYPLSCFKYISSYISKSYNFGCRLKLQDQWEALHKNLSLFKLSSKFRIALDHSHIIVFHSISPSPDLFVHMNSDSIFISIHDRDNNVTHAIDVPPFDLFDVSSISVYILQDNYELDTDTCYYEVLRMMTLLYFQRLPLNNNSPSSE